MYLFFIFLNCSFVNTSVYRLSLLTSEFKSNKKKKACENRKYQKKIFKNANICATNTANVKIHTLPSVNCRYSMLIYKKILTI